MSKTTLGIFIAAIALIVLAVAFNVTAVAGGAGAVLMIGLIYAFVVTKRDADRSATGSSSAD